MMRSGIASAAVTAMMLFLATEAFYLPGIDPISHGDGDNITVDVNSLSSLSDIFPYDYYRLPFCKPRTLVVKAESLGEIIWGDKRQSSPYVVYMKKNTACSMLDCPASNEAVVREQIDDLEAFINKGYRGHMSIDNLPMFHNGTSIAAQSCTTGLDLPQEQRYLSQRGYALGVHKNCIGKTMINNHLHMTIKYHEEVVNGKRVNYVVGFTGQPYSVKHADESACNALFDPTRVDTPPLTVDDVRAGTKVYWTYGVTWVNESHIRWASRWDAYFETSIADSNGQIHWMYIVASLVITFCMSLIASIILLRTLHRDFNRYNSPDPDENQEEIGWKLVNRDVFRPPHHAPILAALVGNGVQVLLMVGGVLFFALLGFLSPANRGSLLTSMILLFVLMSFVAGYACGKVMKLSSAPQEWKYVFLCGMLFPGAVCGSYFFSDLINANHGASDAVPFLTLLTVFALWLCISVPLTVLGASLAFHQGVIAPATAVGSLSRDIPPQRLQFSPPLIYLIPPLAPLGAAFMELKFILSSLWQGTVYYVFGFLTIVLVVWAITAALTTIIVVYYMLCYENHRWWWSSFLIPGCLGLHLFIYTIYFFEQELDITSTAATTVYFIYMGLAAAAYGVAAGAIGFISSMLFARKIYGALKVE
jgi:transmembrane 9 superfamily protein 2/4